MNSQNNSIMEKLSHGSEWVRQQNIKVEGIMADILTSSNFSVSDWEKDNGREIIDASTNDYFSLRRIPSATYKMIDEIKSEVDLQSEAFRKVESSPHTPLREKLIQLLDSEYILFGVSGYTINLITILKLIGRDTTIYSDFRNHMSWHTAIECSIGNNTLDILGNRNFSSATAFEKLKYSKPHLFKHNSPKYLEKLIKKYGAGIVIVEGVYSVEGDMINPDIVNVAKENDCLIIMDESHSIGWTVTEKSMTINQELNLDVDIITFSLSKAFAGHGGALAIQPALVKKYLDYKKIELGKVEFTTLEIKVERDLLFDHFKCAGPLVFSNSADVVGVLERIEALLSDESHRPMIVRNASVDITTYLKKIGINIASESPIIFIEVGSPGDSVKFRDKLLEYGIIGSLYMPPSTPNKRTGIRFVINYNFAKDTQKIERFKVALLETCKIFKIDQYPTSKSSRRRYSDYGALK